VGNGTAEDGGRSRVWHWGIDSMSAGRIALPEM
jgi:hypothetical protein